MEEQKIAKNRRQVHFTLAGGDEVEGEVFLNLFQVNHPSPQRVGELLNGEDAFIPVKTADGVLQLNVSNIVTARTEAQWERDELMTLGKRYPVRITTLEGEEIEGEVYVNLPEVRSRVRDYLNQPQRFFRVFLPEHIVYVGARFILSVRD